MKLLGQQKGGKDFPLVFGFCFLAVSSCFTYYCTEFQKFKRHRGKDPSRKEVCSIMDNSSAQPVAMKPWLPPSTGVGAGDTVLEAWTLSRSPGALVTGEGLNLEPEGA